MNNCQYGGEEPQISSFLQESSLRGDFLLICGIDAIQLPSIEGVWLARYGWAVETLFFFFGI